MYESDPVGVLSREVLRERTGELIAEACAWSVGLSDRPYYVRRHGRVTNTGITLGTRAANGQQLTGDEDAPLELSAAPAGSFGDALGALSEDGRVYADRLDERVLAPFALATCIRAAERARERDPVAWAELLDELGEDGDDLEAVVRAAEWDAQVRIDAEQLVLAALAAVPLVEVEAEGLPLSVVHAAEAELAAAARHAEPEPVDLSGALFLARAAIVGAEHDPAAVLQALLDEGLEPDEVRRVLPALNVEPVVADVVTTLLDRLDRERG